MQHLIQLSTFFVVIIAMGISVQAQVMLNEVLSSNGKIFSDEDGDFENWLELYNSGDGTVNLEGICQHLEHWPPYH